MQEKSKLDEKVTNLANSLPEPASMKIQLLFYIVHIIPVRLPGVLLGSFLHLPFSCGDIAPIFADTIVPKKVRDRNLVTYTNGIQRLKRAQKI
jgi:hypothetical protein